MLRSALVLALPVVLLWGCAVEQFAVPSPGDLPSARAACTAQYPRRVGNYLPHALCVNAAVERYAAPTARHPDLIRLQSDARARLSEKIDRRAISSAAGVQRMARVDALIAEAERDRAAGRDGAAARKTAAIDGILR